MTGRFGSGLTLGFGLGQKKQEPEPEKPHFQITEQMMISELPNDIAKQFIEAFDSIQKNASDLSKNATNVSTSTVESDYEAIRKETMECLTGSLVSLAHQIDFGKSSFSEIQKDLKVSNSDYINSSHFRGTPSPFIKRYSSRINKHAEELSQSLASYSSRFQPEQNQPQLNGQNESQILSNVLAEQQKAILRCSSRVAAINDRLERLRSILYTKYKTNININQNEEIQQNLCARKVQDDIKIYLNEIKQKRIKKAEETDLFGNSTVEIPKKVGGFGGALGGAFGARGFGQKNQNNQNSQTKGKSAGLKSQQTS